MINFTNPDEHRTMHFKTTGVIKYELLEDKVDSKNHIGRAAIQINDNELLAYYRFQFYKKFGVLLEKPSWPAHITVMNLEITDEVKEIYGLKNNKVVDVLYSHYMFWNKSMVWIAAEAKELKEIRDYYAYKSMDRGHITIGRFKNQGLIPEFNNFRDIGLWNKYPNNPIY